MEIISESSRVNSPNILIYSKDQKIQNLQEYLNKLLDDERYAVHNIDSETLTSGVWKARTSLFVLVGDLKPNQSDLLHKYFLEGGNILVLHSNFVHTVLPFYNKDVIEETVLTVLENLHIRKKHRILRSDKQDDLEIYRGHSGHELNVNILAREESYGTPSVLKVTNRTNNGITIFAQMYLDSEDDTESTINRLAFLRVLLGELKINLNTEEQIRISYTEGYFLGDKNIIEDAVEKFESNEFCNMTLQFVKKNESPSKEPSETFLPVFLNRTPKNFFSEDYFNHLSTKYIGRLGIYSDVVSSTMDVIEAPIKHGVVSIARRQLNGRGRRGNNWISPLGQAAVSVQLWQKLSPTVPLFQHAAALAVVLAIRKSHQDFDIRIKWPNDIYYGRDVKIGGVIATASCMADDVYVNIGTGVNIHNKVPTTCINEIIEEHNRDNDSNLPPITIECFIARYCSELELIIDTINSIDGVKKFQKQYYEYWLHSNEEIRVMVEKDEEPVRGVVKGIDEAGWLVVETDGGVVTVTPDGNTFDMMSGLIAPKY